MPFDITAMAAKVKEKMAAGSGKPLLPPTNIHPEGSVAQETTDSHIDAALAPVPEAEKVVAPPMEPPAAPVPEKKKPAPKKKAEPVVAPAPAPEPPPAPAPAPKPVLKVVEQVEAPKVINVSAAPMQQPVGVEACVLTRAYTIWRTEFGKNYPDRFRQFPQEDDASFAFRATLAQERNRSEVRMDTVVLDVPEGHALHAFAYNGEAYAQIPESLMRMVVPTVSKAIVQVAGKYLKVINIVNPERR